MKVMYVIAQQVAGGVAGNAAMSSPPREATTIRVRILNVGLSNLYKSRGRTRGYPPVTRQTPERRRSRGTFMKEVAL